MSKHFRALVLSLGILSGVLWFTSERLDWPTYVMPIYWLGSTTVVALYAYRSSR